MRSFAIRSFALGLVLGLVAGPVADTATFGQLPETRLHSLFPPGGQAGQTVEVKVTGGTDMEETDALHFGHPGIKSAPKMQEVAGEQVPVENTFVVTIDAGVPEGNYEVRLGGYFGVSNPRIFAVGSRTETVESERNNDFEEADETAIGTVVNATCNGGADLDFYKFTGKKGQRIVAAVQARRIDSKLNPVIEVYDAARRRIGRAHDVVRGDAVLDLELPADGEFFCKIYDFAYLGSADHFYRFEMHAGPHVDFILPPCGPPNSNEEYTVYGRNLPGGEPSGVKLRGRELQQLKVRIKLPAEDAVVDLDPDTVMAPHEAGVDAITWRLETPQGRSNAKLVYLAAAPVAREAEPNDEPKSAQKVSLPVEVVGQFQERGDIDHVTFEAKKDEVWFIEVFGHRQGGSSADPYFVLDQITTNDKGEETVKRITAQDDYAPTVDNNRPKPTSGLFTLATADPVYRFAVPADGTYRLQVRDRYFENRGDPSLLYRLAITPERPDFRLVVLPVAPPAANQPPKAGSITLRRGENVLVPVMAVKRSGFDGIVELRVDGLPPGITASPAVIGPGDVGTTLVLSAAENAAVGFGEISVVGTSRITDPAVDRAIEEAKKGFPKLRSDLPKLEQAANKANDDLKPVEEDLAKAKAAAAEKPDDENLGKQVEAAQQKFDKAAEDAKKANDALAEKQQEVAALEATVAKQQQERDKTARDVTRPARFATIVWDGQNNVAPTTMRLVRGLGVSVVEEMAPYQVTSDVNRVEVNQGRQVLVPVKLLKRDGFDEQVNLVFQGLPKNSNVQTTNVNIPKGKDEELLRLYVANNALVGAYTVYLTAQSSVNYERNPKRAERLKERQKKVDEMLKAANEAKKAADADKAAADKAATDAAAALKTAQQNLAKAEADAKAKPEDKDAQQGVEAAKKEVADAEAVVKTTGEAKPKAEQAAKAADDAVKELTNVKKQVDTDAKNAETAAKAKKTNITPPSTPVVLIVKPAPAQITANVPNGGALKKGQKLDVKVTVKRADDFAGPVTLDLPDLPNVKGLSAAPVTIPADQTEGVLTIAAGGDAADGQVPNAVVRATMDHDGKAAVDVPVTIKISK